jgi:carboxylesterase type B
VLRGEYDGESRRFLGIPYAAPPVGALRWRPPQPPVPWFLRYIVENAAMSPKVPTRLPFHFAPWDWEQSSS